VRQDERAPFVRALHAARVTAYPRGEFVEQESFMRAGEIRELARRAGIATGVSVLDLCCGIGGPGRLIARESGCTYLGVDYSADAIDLARARAAGLRCRFEVARIPPLPPGPFDVVLLLETMLAFEEKEPLLREISAALARGGRFACTVEAGEPLSEEERGTMPDPDTVSLVPLDELLACFDAAGLAVRSEEDCTSSHLATAEALTEAFAAGAADIAAVIGEDALAELLSAHRLWVEWLRAGRVRKVSLVAEKT
jgi:SAM-dependent methyltransferase